MPLARPNLYIGYHGCSEEHGMEMLKRNSIENLHQSTGDYEWLGHGFYVWENNYARAKAWRKRDYKAHKQPFVVGVIYSLDECLDMTDSGCLTLVQSAYETLKITSEKAGESLPHNEPVSVNDLTGILGKRKLDCFVIEQLHSTMDNESSEKKFDPWYCKDLSRIVKPFETVRAAFFEGDEIYPGATFRSKDHIQICIRNPKCIKGFFRPLDMM